MTLSLNTSTLWHLTYIYYLTSVVSEGLFSSLLDSNYLFVLNRPVPSSSSRKVRLLYTCDSRPLSHVPHNFPELLSTIYRYLWYPTTLRLLPSASGKSQSTRNTWIKTFKFLRNFSNFGSLTVLHQKTHTFLWGPTSYLFSNLHRLSPKTPFSFSTDPSETSKGQKTSYHGPLLLDLSSFTLSDSRTLVWTT